MSEGKHPGGRPTKYKPEFCDMIIKYFDKPPTREIYKTEYNKDGSIKSEIPIMVPAEFPTFQGFAHSINVNMDSLSEWIKVHPEFSVAYAHAKQIQESIWLQNGMSGLYNSQFAQFFGKNCLGYKDRAEVEINPDQDGVIKVSFVNSDE